MGSTNIRKAVFLFFYASLFPLLCLEEYGSALSRGPACSSMDPHPGCREPAGDDLGLRRGEGCRPALGQRGAQPDLGLWAVWERPWGVATIDLKTSGRGHYTLFLSPYPQHGRENRHDDRTGRIDARLSMGQARPREDPPYCRGDNRLGGVVSPGRPTRPPAVLARALPATDAGAGRSRRRRVRRWWSGPALDQATISPALLRLALALCVAAQPVGVALDTTRLGGWAVWWAGVVVAGRTLPIGWAVLP
jgi:hypothetical protein